MKKNKAFILYENFYTPDGKTMSIGGIQTYIKMLIDVVKKLNLTPVVLQYSDRNFKNSYFGVDVYGVKMKPTWSKRRKNKELYKKCKEIMDHQKDIIIFASDTMIVKNNYTRVIGIQHGITWDLSKHKHFSHFKNLLYIFWRALIAFRIIKRLSYVNYLVCVDYNFLNWYRTQVAYIETDVSVIPNCTVVKEFSKNDKNNIDIIFARRFHKYRGTKLFASVALKLINQHKNVSITFAGTGPDEKYLREKFKNFSNVNFIKYDSEKSLEIHKYYQIAVIPTLGSEGTSLSLLEAMASKCAVVATNVGGMTNIIIDNFNGLLVNPDENELYEALNKLILDGKLRNELAENAFRTVLSSFNKDNWEKRWESVLKKFLNN